MKYSDDISIDPMALDLELLKQASLMLEYGENMTQLRRERDYTLERLSVKKAELDGLMRNNPEKYKLPKVTDTAIANAITHNKEYMALNKACIEAAYEYNMAQIAVTSLEQKKSALDNLVKLYGQQYFAGPDLPRDLPKEWNKLRENLQNETNTKIVRKLKRKHKSS